MNFWITLERYMNLKVSSIILFLSINSYATDRDYSSAMNNSLRAFYAQTGLDVFVNSKTTELDKRYTPEFVKEYGVAPLIILKVAVQGKLEWKFTFP